LCGVIVDVDAETGGCVAIKRLSLLLDESPCGTPETGLSKLPVPDTLR